MPSHQFIDLYYLREINLLIKEKTMEFSLLDFIIYSALMSSLVVLLYRDAIIPSVKNWLKGRK